MDRFVEQVRGQLRAEGIADSNLDRLWTDVLSERRDPKIASLRRFEALLGLDPDQGIESVLEALVDDMASLGEQAMIEIAADPPESGPLPTAAILQEAAGKNGVAASPSAAVHLRPDELPPFGSVAAWLLGSKAAQELRRQEKLGSSPLGNSILCQMAAVGEAVLTSPPTHNVPLSFALDDSNKAGRVVLRSKWETGRRFDLARLLGDRITGSGGRLFPATRAYTYRQKLQRSFAAELLCPFDALEGFLGGDYSEDNQRDAAEHFSVSELMISTILVNHGRLDHVDIEKDVETIVAA